MVPPVALDILRLTVFSPKGAMRCQPKATLLKLRSFVGRVPWPAFFRVQLVGPGDPTYEKNGEIQLAQLQKATPWVRDSRGKESPEGAALIRWTTKGRPFRASNSSVIGTQGDAPVGRLPWADIGLPLWGERNLATPEQPRHKLSGEHGYLQKNNRTRCNPGIPRCG